MLAALDASPRMTQAARDYLAECAASWVAVLRGRGLTDAQVMRRCLDEAEAATASKLDDLSDQEVYFEAVRRAVAAEIARPR